MSPLDLSTVSTILVVRTDHIGDLVLSTPWLKSLRKAAPHAHITARVAPYLESVLKPGHLVDEVTSDQLPLTDVAVSLAPRSASLKLVYRSGAAVRVGYIYSGRPLVALASKLWLTHCQTVHVDPNGKVPHEVEQLRGLANQMGFDYIPGDLDLGLEPQERGDFVALHLGNRWFTGGWTPADMVELARAVSGRVVVTAGPAERGQAQEVSRLAPDLDLRDGMGFDEWVAVLGRARAVLSCDTGAVHLAAAQKTPVVVAYEPATFNLCSQQWKPWGVEHRQLKKEEPRATIPLLAAAVKELL